MPPFTTNVARRNRLPLLFLAGIALLLASPHLQAKTPRDQKKTVFSVALQPFSLVHSVVHTAAAPVIDNAPRILRAAAVAPIKVAYYAPRAIAASVPHNRRTNEYDQEDEEDPDRPDEYRVGRQALDGEPEPELDRYDDEEATEEEEPQQIERHGKRPIVTGKRAVLRNGVAYAPSGAPESVKNAIWAANTLRRRPYVWGGGHRSFYDRGYDCSGSVSFALHSAGLLSAPLPSEDLMRYGMRGRGRWITVYSRPGHTFAVIAGLRLDTTDLERGGSVGPRWYSAGRSTRGYVARHPAGL